MKITIERSILLRALSHIQNVVERRNTIPVLSNVLLKAVKTQDGRLSLTATDMDLEMVETIPAAVERAGTVTIPAHLLFDIVRKLPDGVQIELDVPDKGGQMRLKSGRSSFNLGCLPSEDYPQMQMGDMSHNFEISAKDLRTLIDRARFAISTEETRYYLNGIYFHATKMKNDAVEIPVLRSVATDGHRLARVEMPLPEGADGMPGIILPRKTVGELRKLLDEGTDRVQVSLSANKVRFILGPIVLTSKLIDGTFPDYERVIPSANDKILEIDAKVFSGAVDRVAAISTEKSRAIKLSIKNDNIVLSATSPEAGSAVEELEVDFKGPSIDIGFNSRYLLDIMSQIEGTGARFAFADSGSPAIVRDVSDTSALYVLMPMRV